MQHNELIAIDNHMVRYYADIIQAPELPLIEAQLHPLSQLIIK